MVKEKSVFNVSDIKVPEGQEIKGFRVDCPVHGNVSKSVFPIMHQGKDGKNQIQFICKACLSEYFAQLVEDGQLAAVKVTPVFAPKSANSSEEKAENAESGSGSEGQEAT